MKHTADLQNGLTKMNDFIYTKAGTCITLRWRQMGWIPASEDPAIVEKWKRYQSLPSQSLKLSASCVEHIQESSS